MPHLWPQARPLLACSNCLSRRMSFSPLEAGTCVREAVRQSNTAAVAVELLLRLASRRRSSLSLTLVSVRTSTRTRYRLSSFLSLWFAGCAFLEPRQ